MVPRAMNVDGRLAAAYLLGIVWSIGIGSASTASIASAAEPPIDFSRDIRPILAKHCFACHGPDDHVRKGKLRLDTESGAKQERKGVHVVHAGSAARSSLIDRVMATDDLRMPPKKNGPGLTAEQVALLKRWIDGGAVWGKHWAFEKPIRGPVPVVHSTEFPTGGLRDPIDFFIAARLQAAGLRMSAPADPRTLARRMALDLTGIPPSVSEVDAVTSDPAVDAWERYVDRLLASPAFGERFARVWLDLARYADTKGYEKDLMRSMWRYRDWVIQAFNEDMPYDRFTREQHAGDMFTQSTYENQLATAFHRNTMVNDEGGTDDEEFRIAAVKDRVDTTMQVWMGLTAGCAKCHNHKYDPISMKDYYRLFAIFNQTQDNDSSDEQPRIATPTALQYAEYYKLQAEIRELNQRIYAYDDAFKAECSKWEASAKKRRGWLPLEPTMQSASSGSTMKILDDRSTLVQPRYPARDTYTISSKSPVDRISAIRLEVIPDPSLPRGGVGRAENDGNFVLSRIRVRIIDSKGKGTEVKLVKAQADFSQTGYPIEHAIEGPDPRKNGWAVSPEQTKPHSAMFVPAEPTAVPADSMLEISLDHQFEWTVPGFSIGRFRLSVTSDDGPSLSGELPDHVKFILGIPAAERAASQANQLYAFFAANISTTVRPFRERQESLTRQSQAMIVPYTPILRELPQANWRATRIHNKGNFLDPGELVFPAVPESFHPLPQRVIANRYGLAEWLISSDNPLSARVAANRVWAMFFGLGIVESQEDFGTQGMAPSHPELLDWLAREYQDSGWSLKQLCRRIVLSTAYRQSSSATPDLLKVDPRNRLLARGPRFRLEAEMVRDSSLSAAGLLTQKIGGPSVMPPQPEGTWKSAYSSEKWVDAVGPDRYRRGVYTFIKRTAPYPSMAVFDAPSREICSTRRISTNTPLQALVTLNDPAYIEAAKALARRMRSAGAESAEWIRDGFRRVTLRDPIAEEARTLAELYAVRLAYYRLHPEDARKFGIDVLQSPPDASIDVAELAALTAVANVLLNLDEFLTRN